MSRAPTPMLDPLFVISRPWRDDNVYWLPADASRGNVVMDIMGDWTMDQKDAVRFANKASADLIIKRLLGGIGRTYEYTGERT